MKLKFLSLFLALGIFALGTSVMAVPSEKQSSSSEKMVIQDDGAWSAAVATFKSAVSTVLAPAVKLLPTDILSQAKGCESIYDATAQKVYPQCVFSCVQELSKATSTNPITQGLIAAASKAAKGAETAASAVCKFCTVDSCSIPCPSDSTPCLAKACGAICCPFTSTQQAANTCLTAAKLEACGTTSFPTTCNETTKEKAFLIK